MPTLFHQKSVSLFAKKQTAMGTIATPASIDAIAATKLTHTQNYETSTEEYLGDPASRAAIVSILDVSETIEIEAPISLAPVGTPPVYTSLLEACGVNAIVVAAAPTANPPVLGQCSYSNSSINNTYSTLQFRRRSSTIATEKTYVLSDCRGTLDIILEVNKRPLFVFKLTGNRADPTQQAALAASYGNQVVQAYLAPVLKSGNVVPSQILFGGKQICLTKFTAQNFFGMDLQRYSLICQTGQQTDLLIPEYTIEYIEQDVSATTIADESLAASGTGVPLSMTIGTLVGKRFRIEIPTGFIKDIKYGTQGNFVTKSVTVVNTGLANLTFF
jgi:hypothetical protein